MGPRLSQWKSRLVKYDSDSCGVWATFQHISGNWCGDEISKLSKADHLSTEASIIWHTVNPWIIHFVQKWCLNGHLMWHFCGFVIVSRTYHLSLGHVSRRVWFERMRGEIWFHLARLYQYPYQYRNNMDDPNYPLFNVHPIVWSKSSTTRWFQICFIFTPSWGNDPIWRAYFFKWVGSTTN